ncbi:unnamed protein product [Pseudo-nitzschia multistriata]|uniref:Uncharacterized protein n=1 Tax=Pseudo-nitzschia multistriata TaxID=183589 RepID=A0A448Z323_9STRA|nr:unnamed protein product [Pseudo-nitzschia multistriata]
MVVGDGSRRRSSRLEAGQKRKRPGGLGAAADGATFHRPRATGSAAQQDCGILPSDGDLYGGGHYLEAASSNETPQGRAVLEAALRFGTGGTLPFCPCKRGYKPVSEGPPPRRMVACSFHEAARRKRLARDKGKLRGGEADPSELFWSPKLSSEESRAELPPPPGSSREKAREKSSEKGDGQHDTKTAT